MLRSKIGPSFFSAGVACVVACCGAARAQSARLVPLGEPSDDAREFALLPVAGLTAPPTATPPSTPAAPTPPATPAPAEPTPAHADGELVVPGAPPKFAQAGSDWWTVGAGAAVGRRTHVDANVYGAWSHFVADDVEVAAELGVWYYAQEGDDAAGINPNIVFRWHFVHEDDFTIFTDIGIGVLAATDNVPSGGTSFDFTPRAGVGFTYALNDAGNVRLVGGLRWAHVSNARIHGDDNNPGLDSVMLYSGVQFPF